MSRLYGFRYHIMTLIAVFLSLGLGLLLGGTLGEEVIVKEQVQLLEQLEERYTQTKADNVKLKRQNGELTRDQDQLERVIAQVGGHYVKDRLAGQKVAVLQLEAADLSGLLTQLQAAGANVTSTVALTNALPLLDVRQEPLLQAIGGTTGKEAKAVHQALAELLVRELYLQKGGRLVDYLQSTNALTASGELGVRPDRVVLVGGAGESGKSRLTAVDLPLLKALQKQELYTACVEQSDVSHSAVAHYRELGISTVDNIDQVTGLVALIDILGGAKGHFGVKKTAEALLPQVTNAKEVSAQ
ncbi:copper transporter [Tumebacillus sp. BK434]|uniref:copper transporter n=1 Tax=Tumebacillus sp. BK434 TaxID=2512169 RepID=UPI00140469D8|nr:copper transporter [Tumebacillus sp. BK434]